MSSKSLCFTCRELPAEGASAYCPSCQPRDTRPQLRGDQHGCAACGRVLATLHDFDAHQEHYPHGHIEEGVFTGRCLDPVSLGLEMKNWAWGTKSGNAHRGKLADRMRSHSQASPAK